MERIDLLWIMSLNYKKNWGFKKHSHAYYQFFFVVSGSEHEHMIVNDKKIRLRDNEFIFINKDTEHELLPIDESSINLIDVKFSTEDKEIAEMLEKFPESISVKNEKIYELLCEIKENWKEEQNLSERILSLQVEILLLLVFKELEEDLFGEKFEKNRIKRMRKFIRTKIENSDEATLKVINYIEENYTTDFSLDDLARKLNYSKEYLCRDFRKNTTWTIGYYFNYLKIVKALEMLKNRENSIESISESLSFSSTQYFSKVFKKMVGLSPNEFRKSRFKESVSDALEHGNFSYRYNNKTKK